MLGTEDLDGQATDDGSLSGRLRALGLKDLQDMSTGNSRATSLQYEDSTIRNIEFLKKLQQYQLGGVNVSEFDVYTGVDYHGEGNPGYMDECSTEGSSPETTHSSNEMETALFKEYLISRQQMIGHGGMDGAGDGESSGSASSDSAITVESDIHIRTHAKKGTKARKSSIFSITSAPRTTATSKTAAVDVAMTTPTEDDEDFEDVKATPKNQERRNVLRIGIPAGKLPSPLPSPTHVGGSWKHLEEHERGVNRKSLLSIIGTMTTNMVSNWSGVNHIANKRQIIIPKDVYEISKVFLDAQSDIANNNDGYHVRIVGAGMSYEKVFSLDNVTDESQDIVIDMCEFSGLYKFTKNSSTFGSSTSVNDVIKILASKGKMLDCSPGVIGVQTLGGAISTGTHGQGTKQSCYADTVLSIEAVLPNGKVVYVNRKQGFYRNGEQDVPDTKGEIPPLSALVASLGTLCVLTQIEVSHSKRRLFKCHKKMCDYDVFLKEYNHWNEQFEYAKAWWFPETDKVHVWVVDEATAEEAEYYHEVNRQRRKRIDTPCHSKSNSQSSVDMDEFIDEELVDLDMDAETKLNSTVDMYLKALFRDTGVSLKDSAEHPHSLTLQRFYDAKDCIGHLEQIVTKGIPVPQINCEVAVKLSKFKRATEVLKAWSLKNPGKLHYPFIYRATGPSSRTMLYPAYGYDEGIAYIGFLVYLAADGSVRDDGMETMREIQKLLSDECSGLPHMGKHFIPELYKLGVMNDGKDDKDDCHKGIPLIKEYQKKVDPSGILMNSFLRRVFNN